MLCVVLMTIYGEFGYYRELCDAQELVIISCHLYSYNDDPMKLFLMLTSVGIVHRMTTCHLEPDE